MSVNDGVFAGHACMGDVKDLCACAKPESVKWDGAASVLLKAAGRCDADGVGTMVEVRLATAGSEIPSGLGPTRLREWTVSAGGRLDVAELKPAAAG